MTKTEIQYMDHLLLRLIDQRRRLDEMIESIQEVLKYSRSVHVSMKCTELDHTKRERKRWARKRMASDSSA